MSLSTAPSTAADTSSRLLILPRELRDMIYDYLGQDIPLRRIFRKVPGYQTSKYFKTRISITQGPRAGLLRVSKQFSSEYLERVREMGRMDIQDYSFRLPSEAKKRKLKRPLRYVQNVQICHWSRSHLYGLDAVERCRDWMGRLQSLSGRPLRLDLIIENKWEYKRYSYEDHKTHPNDGWNPLMPPYTDGNLPLLKEYEELPGIRSIQVQCSPFVRCWKYAMLHSMHTDICNSSEPGVYGTWTPEAGWTPGKHGRSHIQCVVRAREIEDRWE